MEEKRVPGLPRSQSAVGVDPGVEAGMRGARNRIFFGTVRSGSRGYARPLRGTVQGRFGRYYVARNAAQSSLQAEASAFGHGRFRDRGSAARGRRDTQDQFAT